MQATRRDVIVATAGSPVLRSTAGTDDPDDPTVLVVPEDVTYTADGGAFHGIDWEAGGRLRLPDRERLSLRDAWFRPFVDSSFAVDIDGLLEGFRTWRHGELGTARFLALVEAWFAGGPIVNYHVPESR